MMKSEKGLVIVAVLWICALIMWFALQIGAEVRLRGEDEVHLLRRSQALHLAIGGAYEAIARMGQPPPLDADAAPEENWQPDGRPRTVEYETGQAIVIVEKETDKVNVNIAGHEGIKAVLEEAGLEEDSAEQLADVINDFIDPDEFTSLQGDEKAGYDQMGVHYGPFNGVLRSLDQMLLIPGITQQLFFGHGRQSEDLSEDESATSRIPLLPGANSLFELLTVYGNKKTLDEGIEESIEIDIGENELTELVVWEAGGIYRILSCGKIASGAPSALLWMIVRYAPASTNGYEVLYRKIL